MISHNLSTLTELEQRRVEDWAVAQCAKADKEVAFLIIEDDKPALRKRIEEVGFLVSSSKNGNKLHCILRNRQDVIANTTIVSNE